MEPTKLTTIEDVTVAISALHGVTAAYLRRLKPAQERQRAARLADLYEIRARMFAELDLTAIPAGLLHDVATAAARAAQADRDSMKFWRGLAGAR